MCENKTTASEVKFTRTDTKAIKGVAVLLMLYHHLVAFVTRYPVGFGGFESIFPGYAESEYPIALAMAAKLCVPLFFFMGGYGMYSRFKAGKFSVKDSIIGLYKSYWKVFFIFVPIALIFFARSGADVNELATRYTFADAKTAINTVISNFVGYSASLNNEWWFFASYICVLPMGYLFCKATKKVHNFWVDLFIAFGIDILLSGFFPGLIKVEAFGGLYSNHFYRQFLTINGSAGAFFVGIVMAKYDGICTIKKILRSLPCGTLLSFAGVLMLYWCRAFMIAGSYEIVYCMIAVPMLSVVFDKVKILKKIFGVVGKHSTNMWLIHTFYTYYFLEATLVVYCTHNAFISFLILVEMCLASSLLVNGFWKGLGMLGTKMNEKYTTYKLSRESKKLEEAHASEGEEASDLVAEEAEPMMTAEAVANADEPEAVEEVAATVAEVEAERALEEESN